MNVEVRDNPQKAPVTTHRLQHLLLPHPALVQNMKLESSVAPTAWFGACGVVHLVETCMNETKIIETMKSYVHRGRPSVHSTVICSV